MIYGQFNIKHTIKIESELFKVYSSLWSSDRENIRTFIARIKKVVKFCETRVYWTEIIEKTSCWFFRTNQTILKKNRL